MVNILGKELEAKQEQQLKIIILLLVAGTIFYFNVYLLEQQRQQLEMQMQETIDKVTKAQSHEYSS